MKHSVSQKTILILSGAMALLSLPACNGLAGDPYDKPQPEKEYGFVTVDEASHSGRIFIDATDYTQWHYIDLHSRQVTAAAVDADAPENWDFAVHRYDAKTNGGAVAEAGESGSVPEPGSVPAESFIEDEWTTDRITVDMSQMMAGTIVYAEDWYNPCLSGWLDLDTSSMPPVYTLSKSTFLLRLKDGTYAALRLVNFMNDTGVKGYMTIDWTYPVEKL